ncbi:hypothetical protein ACIPXS_19045 [Streptomyces hydrogenans]|uniref:hypothetical protein n=1 Tax=Streptomyces hydrogenans TaxID=1873719 RepID=UPI0037F2DB7A
MLAEGVSPAGRGAPAEALVPHRGRCRPAGFERYDGGQVPTVELSHLDLVLLGDADLDQGVRRVMQVRLGAAACSSRSALGTAPRWVLPG